MPGLRGHGSEVEQVQSSGRDLSLSLSLSALGAPVVVFGVLHLVLSPCLHHHTAAKFVCVCGERVSECVCVCVCVCHSLYGHS
jgi:hypothetical protein